MCDEQLDNKASIKTMPSRQAPFVANDLVVKPEWIDFNGHLNMAFYMVLFDEASDAAFSSMGMPPTYKSKRSMTLYTAEAHIRYVREVHLTDPLTCTLQLIAHDAKRLHTWQELRHAVDGWLAATCEMMTLHVDATGPRVAPMPEDVAVQVREMQDAHDSLPVPDKLNGSIRIPGAKIPC
ncbi:MAG: thioesterase family protein [Pseudomonadota bacterium]